MRVKLAALVLTAALVPLASATLAPAQGNEADLSVTTQFAGHGSAKARLGQLVTLAVTVHNSGPAAATAINLIGGGTDHFNVISTRCGNATPLFNNQTPCPDLAPGATVSGSVVLQVCCFPVGETRQASAGAIVGSDSTSTLDPDDGNNYSETRIKVIGGRGFG